MPEHFGQFDKPSTSDSIQKDFSRLFGIDIASLEFPEEETALVTADLADSFSRTNASPEEKAEYLFGLRRDLQTALKAIDKKEREKIVLSNLDIRIMLIAYRILLAEEDTTQTLASGFSLHREESQRINGTHEEYTHYRKDLEKADKTLNSILSEIFHERETIINRGKLIRLSIAEKRVDHLENLLKTIQKQNPFTAAQIEYEKIADYSQQLRENGFIWTESRRALFRATLKKAQSDRQMVVLFGETGTGKTSFTRAVSKELSGKESLRTVGGPEDPFRRLLATQSADGWNFGPLLYAMTGLQNSVDQEPKHSGAIYFDDEFNTRPTAIQRQIMKFVSEAKPGRVLRVPGPDCTITVQPGFLYIAAGNPPSARYEREEAGIETQREFSGNIINYGYMEQSATNPELYQILLAAVIDENSKRITIAGKEELSPSFTKKNGQETLDTNPTSGGFLWRFANLWHDLNTAFTQGNQKDKSKIQKTALQLANPAEPLEAFELSEFNLDPGKVLGWIDSFKRSPKIHQSLSLSQYLSEQFKEYMEMAAEEDASALQKYLTFYNLEYAENKYPIQQKTILTHQDIGFLSPNVPRPKEEQTPETKPEPEIPSIETSVIINETGEDIHYFAESFGDFHIGRRFEKKQQQGIRKKKKGDAARYILVGWTTDNIMQKKDKNSIVFEERKIVLQENAKKTGITVTQRELEEGFEKEKFLMIDEAREILGEDVLGPEEVFQAFEVQLVPSEIPPIPYTRDQLEQAKQLGEMLVLRISKDKDGNQLSMKKMQELHETQMIATGKGRLLFSADWYKNEPFFTSQTPSLEWKLVSKQNILHSTNQNYIHQTRILRDYLKQAGSLSPEEERTCTDEILKQLSAEMGVDWNSQNIVDQDKYNAHWKTVAEKLSLLLVNKNHRRTPSEILYDTLLRFISRNNERLIKTEYDWSNTCSSDGVLVRVGYFDSVGARVNGWAPGNPAGPIGVSSSR